MAKQVNLAKDFKADLFENVAVNLFDVYRARFNMGQPIITGVTFRNCRIEGPAVLLAVDGCSFDAVNFGASEDIRSLVLRPASPTSVVGAIPMKNCNFIASTFVGVGFTGPEAFLNQILALGVKA